MIKARNVNATPRRLIIPAVATAGLLGIFISTRSDKSDNEKQGTRAREKRDDDSLHGAGIGGNMMSGGHEKGSFTGKGDSESKVNTTAESRDQLPSGGVGGGTGAGNSNARAVEMRPTGDNSKLRQGGDVAKWLAKGADDASANNGANTSNDDGGIDQDVALKSRSGSNSGASGTKQDGNFKTTSSSYPGSSSSAPGKGTGNSDGKLTAGQTLQGLFGQGGKSAGQPEENKRKYHDPRVHSNDADTPTKRGQMRSDS